MHSIYFRFSSNDDFRLLYKYTQNIIFYILFYWFLSASCYFDTVPMLCETYRNPINYNSHNAQSCNGTERVWQALGSLRNLIFGSEMDAQTKKATEAAAITLDTQDSAEMTIDSTEMQTKSNEQQRRHHHQQQQQRSSSKKTKSKPSSTVNNDTEPSDVLVDERLPIYVWIESNKQFDWHSILRGRKQESSQNCIKTRILFQYKYY